MFLLFFSILITFLVLIFFKTKTRRNMMTIFSSFWLVSILMSMFLSSKLYEVRPIIYNYVYIFVLCTLAGYLLFAKKIKGSQIITNYELKKYSSPLIILKTILLLVLVYYLIKYNQAKVGLPLYKIRIIRYEIGPLFSSGLELLVYNYLLSSLVEFFGLLSIVRIVLTSKIEVGSLLSIVSLLIYSMIGNGRFGLFNSIIFLFAALYYKDVLFKNDNQKNVIRNLKNKFFYGTLSLFFVYGMVKISSTRFEREIESIADIFDVFLDSVEQAVVYFTGPFRALDHFFLHQTTSEDTYYYGRAFFSGLDEMLVNIFSKVDNSLTSVNQVISDYTNPPFAIGPGQYFNAFYTAIFNSYLDWGFFGLFLSGLMLGILAAIIWNFHIKYKNIYSFSLVIYSTLILISSEYRFELQQFKSYFVIFLLIVLSYQSNRRKGNNIEL